MEQWNNELDNLFASYRAAVPDPEASADFMPDLWRKIEARQSLVIRIKRLTQVFVAAAAVICMLFATYLAFPGSSAPEVNGNYVDVLAEIHPAENLAPVGIRTEASE